MATVVEVYTTEEQRYVVRFLLFPVYGGNVLSRKAVHNWAEKFSQGRLKVADDARPGCHINIVTEATV
jgi:hypothetical protein